MDLKGRALCELFLEFLPAWPSCSHGDAELRRRFPLELVSPKSYEGLNSTFSYRPEVDRACAILEIHREDAERRGIKSGDLVEASSDRGSCRLEAQVSENVSPGVVSSRAVRWRANGEPTVNALTSDRLTDSGGGATFYSCLVEVQTC